MKRLMMLFLVLVIAGCSTEPEPQAVLAEEHVLDAFGAIEEQRRYGTLDVLSEDIGGIEWLVFELEGIENDEHVMIQFIVYLFTEQNEEGNSYEAVLMERGWRDGEPVDHDFGYTGGIPWRVDHDAAEDFLDEFEANLEIYIEEVKSYTTDDGDTPYINHELKRGSFDRETITVWQETFENSLDGIREEPQPPVESIVIGGGDWESAMFHSAVAKFIIENGYDLSVDFRYMSTGMMLQALRDGSVHINMEMWGGNIAEFEDDLEEGFYEAVSVNYDDAYQGLYIPQYLADEYPGLQFVQDLPNYKHLFADPHIPSWNPEEDKAVVYGGPADWWITYFLQTKFQNATLYPQLVEHFIFRPVESTTLLNATIREAYENEEPFIAYNWEPSGIMGELDLVLLEDELDYDENSGAGNLPVHTVNVVVTASLKDEYPDIHDFLSHYETSAAITSSVLAYMALEDVSPQEAAEWWLYHNQEQWRHWVPEEVYNAVMDSLSD